jgi:transcriptional regulator with PAS, ATPase and Fis domain
VRELKNVIESAFVLRKPDEESIRQVHLPGWLLRAVEVEKTLPDQGSLMNRVEAMERELILKALRECACNQTRAAEKLGISRQILKYKIEKYGTHAVPGVEG